MKIGVFDSGIGGEAVATRLRHLMPDAKVITANDSVHVPYGAHTDEEILRLTEQALQPLLRASCDAIVIACNTATTVAIAYLRDAYPSQHFVGLEPMIKPAALLTHTGVVAVLATPATLRSQRYAALKRTWATDLTVVEPDCSIWAASIEHGEKIELDAIITSLKEQSVDVIVLACTHYHWIKQDIERLAGPSIRVLEPSDAIGARIRSLVTR